MKLYNHLGAEIFDGGATTPLRDTLIKAVCANADLHGANLSNAYLSNADLSGAIGLNRWRSMPLMMLMDQPGAMRAYKLVLKSNDEGIYNGGLKYTVGATLSVDNADTDPDADCGAGINVAPLDWCLRQYNADLHVIRIVEFTAADIACIPIGDGKFRLHRCTVVGEKDVSAIVALEKDTRP